MAESRVNRENYITVQGFMVKDLMLKGNELLIYAIIYGFSQAENQVFSGSLQYLADWTNSTKQGIMKCLKSLEEKDLIVKQSLMVNKVVYSTKFNASVKQSLMDSVKQSLPNNIVIDNKEDNTKHIYGTYKHIRLTDNELNKLKEQYSNWQELIDYLDEAIERKGYKYKSHYLAIKKWVVDAVNEKKPKQTAQNYTNRDYSRTDLNGLFDNLEDIEL